MLDRPFEPFQLFISGRLFRGRIFLDQLSCEIEIAWLHVLNSLGEIQLLFVSILSLRNSFQRRVYLLLAVLLNIFPC